MKRKIIYFLTIAIIAAFILEFFTVLMWTPGQETPEASPTPQPAEAWEGNAFATAKVFDLTPNFLAECNTTKPDDLTKALAAIEGVDANSVTLLSFPLLSFKTNATALENNSPVLNRQEFYNALNTTFTQANCTPQAKIFREVLLEFKEPINFTGRTQAGEAMNATIYPRDLELYAYKQGLAKPTGFLLAPAEKNVLTGVVIYASFHQGQITRLFVQEIGVE